MGWSSICVRRPTGSCIFRLVSWSQSASVVGVSHQLCLHFRYGLCVSFFSVCLDANRILELELRTKLDHRQYYEVSSGFLDRVIYCLCAESSYPPFFCPRFVMHFGYRSDGLAKIRYHRLFGRCYGLR